VEHFIKQAAPALGKHGGVVPPETMRVLELHSWPGNVRELQSAIKYALVHSRSEVFTPDSLPASTRDSHAAASESTPGSVADPHKLEISSFVRSLLQNAPLEIYSQVIASVDRVVLSEVLRHVKGNQVAAAELLGLSRNTLRAKLRSLGLSIEKQVHPERDHVGQ
jgi:two-component system nitrogen regulation response regulator GlnG